MCGAGISGGGHHGPTRQGGAPRWGGRALHSRGLVLAPPAEISVPKILKYSIKNHTKFAGHLEHFYFWDIFFIARINQKTDKIFYFYFYLF